MVTPDAPMPRGGSVPVGSFHINCRRLGAPLVSSVSRPTLVLLHGFGASSATWLDIDETLAAAMPVVEIDLKGFGYSDRPRDGDYAIESQAEIVLEVLKQLGLQRVILCGHSYGGGVALLTYFLRKDRASGPAVEKLVLIGAASYKQRLPFFMAALANPVARLAAFGLMSPRARARFILNRIMRAPDAVTDERVSRYAFFFSLPGSNYALTMAARQIFPRDQASLVSRLREIDVPVSIIWGDRDPVIPPAFARRLQNDVRHATLHMLPHTGHVPHEELPQDVLQVLMPMLGQ